MSLSGDGGDELFGGYNRYFLGKKPLERSALDTGFPARRAAKGHVDLSGRWSNGFSRFGALMPSVLRQPNAGDKLHKLAEVSAARSPKEMYAKLTSHWKEVSPVLHSTSPVNQEWIELTSFTESMMFLDLITYLPDDILVKLDRATMAVSLEGRAPFLDPRVVEFAWSLPLR